eukprot:3669881-Ditylum_brightwellii.AAC.1
MDNTLQALGFGSRVIEEEKAVELQHSTAKEDGNPPQEEGDGSDGSSSGTDSIKSVENPNSNLSQNSSVASVVTVQIVQNEDSPGEPENRLPLYLIEDVEKKGDFSINHVIKKANKILDCDGNIDADEIEDLHNMSAIAKEIKEKFKEEQQIRNPLHPNQVRRHLQMWTMQAIGLSAAISLCSKKWGLHKSFPTYRCNTCSALTRWKI